MIFFLKRGQLKCLLLLFAIIFLTSLKNPAGAESHKKIKIDYVFFLSSQDLPDSAENKNSFVWSLKDNSTVTKVKDKYDAVSGASIKNSTRDFAEACRNQQKKRMLPAGLYSLMMYAVSKPSLAVKDSFFLQTNDKKISISFRHKDRSFLIESDEDGTLDIQKSFKILQEKDKEENQEENAYSPDTAEENCKTLYSGLLKIRYNKKTSALKIWGSLEEVEVKVKIEKQENKASQPETKELQKKGIPKE